jgi:ribulose-phosphate 3-epimerase
MKIVPAILAENFSTFMTRLRQAERFADYIQIDIMDGKFVDTRSFDPGLIDNALPTIPFEVHLMVDEPLQVLKEINSAYLRKAIFHVEAASDPMEFIKEARARGLNTGLAVRPETPLVSIEELAPRVDDLLFLTVDPGRYGSPFKHEVMEKLVSARQRFTHNTIGADGGVALDNLQAFYDAGLDYVCIGSRIFLGGEPEENYKMFNQYLVQLEGLKRGKKA